MKKKNRSGAVLDHTMGSHHSKQKFLRYGRGSRVSNKNWTNHFNLTESVSVFIVYNNGNCQTYPICVKVPSKIQNIS